VEPVFLTYYPYQIAEGTLRGVCHNSYGVETVSLALVGTGVRDNGTLNTKTGEEHLDPRSKLAAGSGISDVVPAIPVMLT